MEAFLYLCSTKIFCLIPRGGGIYIIFGKAVILSLPELQTILSVFVEFELLETI